MSCVEQASIELAQVKAAGSKQRVDAVTLLALQEVAPQRVVVLDMADDGFNGTAPLD